MQTKQYQELVMSTLIIGPGEYTLLRAGLELGEEFAEYSLSGNSADELGDMLYWLYAISGFIGHELEPVSNEHYATLPGAVAGVLGTIKRLYRDEYKQPRLVLAEPLNKLKYAISNQGWSLKHLMDANSAKLKRRSANNTIKGGGNR